MTTSRWMKVSLAAAVLAAGALTGRSWAQSSVGEPAPDFSLQDAGGTAHTLSAESGKYVVLEWFNPDCPFVRKHYGSGNMQALQKTWTGKGVVWYSINSSAVGKQGNYPAKELEEKMRGEGSAATAVLKDEDGKVGRLYGAKSTPHLFVIDPKGLLVYAGAIDDKPSPKPEDVAGAKNYVAQALQEAMDGKPVSVSSSAAYGCSVKYGD